MRISVTSTIRHLADHACSRTAFNESDVEAARVVFHRTSEYFNLSENSSADVYMRAFWKLSKKALEGCSAQSSHFPMARASADVVATTSLVEGLMKTLNSPRCSAWDTETLKLSGLLREQALIEHMLTEPSSSG